MTTLQTEFNRLFTSFFDTPTTGRTTAVRRWSPAMDLVETEDHFVLRADLPGLTQDDVKIELVEDVLTVSGERREQQEERRGGYYRLERGMGSFARSLRLPEGVDGEAITAHFRNGVLEVRVPKPAARKPRRVAITVGDGAPRAVEAGETVEGTASEPAAA